jgi:hypothetical protein
MPMVKISQRKLASLLLGIANCQFVGITALTVPEMRKTGNPWHGTTVKISRVNGAINWRYETAVNAQLKRENKPDAFTAFPRVWGKRIKDTPLVIHCTEDEGTQLYLEVKVERREVGYFCTETFERIPTDVIEKFMSKKKKRSRQGTDKQIVLKDFRLDHIAEITVNRDTWRITPLWFQHQIYLPNRPADPQKELVTA